MGVANKPDSTSNAHKIVVGAIVTALTVVLLWLTSVFVFNKLTILIISTVLIAIVVIEIDRKIAWSTYSVSSILGVMIVPNKTIMVYYIVLFGNYAIVKQMIEIISTKKWLHVCLKAVYFNGALIIMAATVQLITGVSVLNSIDLNGLIEKVGNIQLSTTIILGIIAYQVTWGIMDYLLSKTIMLYYQRFYKKIF